MSDSSQNRMDIEFCEELTGLEQNRAELGKAIDNAIVSLKSMAVRKRQLLALQRARAANLAARALISMLNNLTSPARSHGKQTWKQR